MLFRLLETYGWLGTILWDWITRFWGWATHDASGFFTMLLTGIAVFQLGLFYRQLSFMRASIAEAKSATIPATEAATAAKLNAQAVIDAEPSAAERCSAPTKASCQDRLVDHSASAAS